MGKIKPFSLAFVFIDFIASTKMAVPNEFVDLQEELDKAKENLKYVDENIKKLTGRDPSEFRFGPPRRGIPGQPERQLNRVVGGFGRRDLGGDGSSNNRRPMSTFSRLGARGGRHRSREQDSADEDELPNKPTMQSSVVANPKEQKTRKDCIEEQKPDARGLARNRRMFGLLLGTLQKFRVEEQQKQNKEQKRVEIEKKLEEMAEREKEELKKERRELFLERRKKQADLRQLEYKMELVKQLEEWEQHHRQLVNFIRTKHEPHIYYLPAKHTAVSKRRLEESQALVKADITKLRKTVEEEFKSIGKRRQTVGENEGEEMEEEGNAKDSFVEGESVQIVLDHPTAEIQTDEVYEESKEFVVCDAFEKTIVNQNLEEGIPMEVGSEVGNEGAPLPELLEGTDDKVQHLVTKQEDAIMSYDRQEESEEKELDAIDPNKLTEKEFEPIYD